MVLSPTGAKPDFIDLFLASSWIVLRLGLMAREPVHSAPGTRAPSPLKRPSAVRAFPLRLVAQMHIVAFLAVKEGKRSVAAFFG